MGEVLFSERYNEKELYQAIGKQITFCQDNQASSIKGVLRGLHYQLPPFSQTKLVEVLQGSVLDIIVDIRKGSPTFGQHFSQELNDLNRLQLLIPRGFAHGYITLSETSLFQYKVDQYYHPKSEGSIAPDDPSLGIDWRLPKANGYNLIKTSNTPASVRHPFLILKMTCMPNYLVTGSEGQLGMCFHSIQSEFPQYQLLFASQSEVDITQVKNTLKLL